MQTPPPPPTPRWHPRTSDLLSQVLLALRIALEIYYQIMKSRLEMATCPAFRTLGAARLELSPSLPKTSGIALESRDLALCSASLVWL